MMVCVDMCGRDRVGFLRVCVCVCVFVFSERGEWKWPLSGMEASEDDPLTMKFDDPPSPSDTEFSLTLPWALNLGARVKRLQNVLLINQRVRVRVRVFLFFFLFLYIPSSSFFIKQTLPGSFFMRFTLYTEYF